MKKTILTLIITLIYVITFGQDQVNAPKIISTVPSFGDCNVDPEINEIIIKFDQDMGPGFSIPDYKNMPKITDKPKWIDKRTLSVPVKLDSNQFYNLFFNNWKFRNFKNSYGIPLNPDNLLFLTKGDYESDFDKEAYTEFLSIFPKMYSYASFKQIDWTELIEQHKLELENSKTNLEFTLKLLNILKKAEDPHIWIEYNDQKFYTNTSKFFVNNYNISEIVENLEEKNISKNKIIVSGKYGDIGYIFIASWDNSKKDEILTAINRLYEFKSLKNIIIDVRANSGGDERLAQEFASCFTDDSLAYEIVKNYNEKTEKFDKEYIKKVYANKEAFKYEGDVYVLVGPRVMSSNEAFVMMMKQIANAKIVGMNTYGSSGNPKPYKLSNDITIYLPSWQTYTLDNKLIEGYGIEPDIEIINSRADFKNKDGLFEEVINIIENNK